MLSVCYAHSRMRSEPEPSGLPVTGGSAMHFRFRLRTLFVLVACVAMLIVVVPHWIPKGTGVARGEAEAKQQIRRGHITIYTYNMYDSDSRYDASTGLPIEQIGAGPLRPGDDAMNRVWGHNEYVRRWIAQGNVPPNSLKKYDRLILAPLLSVDGSSFVDLPLQTPVRIGSFRIVYSRSVHSGIRTHDIFVRGPATRWKHQVYGKDTKQFSAALISDDKILAIRCFFPGRNANESDKYERVDLLDSYTGICLAVDSRLGCVSSELDSSELKTDSPPEDGPQQ